MNQDKLYILWTNADPVTAKLMVMMYAKNSLKNGWWKEVTVIVWGATVKLLAEDEEIRAEFEECRKMGVEFEGCIACAQELDLVEETEALGITLRKWGPPLTEIIKNGEHLITI
ncbi:Uncharacterized protein conserved in archaea [uncultured Roseburia sp.]|uniref:DsrE family protein n=1 Tax=Brotonthovivens ammoniilytica TaxID=2981725 RepID=A0ABT2TJH0_9FIRM|nr:DsrE family protein [Brotonthovivens ammoniilytica]MCU6762252.1 DsrE family protein [Brotonthovivens ammoniilytica]SCI60203.1 Uncharacterized protein conserved in archaea [uncultured Roseburia sp.]